MTTMRLIGMRHHQPDEMEVDTIEEAVGLFYWGQADGTWNPERLVDEKGEVLMDKDELWASAKRRGLDA